MAGPPKDVIPSLRKALNNRANGGLWRALFIRASLTTTPKTGSGISDDVHQENGRQKILVGTCEMDSLISENLPDGSLQATATGFPSGGI
jgi:hypothetical protein